jgi:hypothetical protein
MKSTTPARHQLPVENDVVELAKNDDLGPGVTIFSELFELREQRIPAGGGLEYDHIRRRRALVGFKRGGRAAHVLLDMRLRHSAIGYRGGDNGCDIGRFAERLDRNARHRLDLHDRPVHRRVVVASSVSVLRLHGHSVPLVLVGRPPPIGASTAFFQSVLGSWPLRTASMARVRMATSDGPTARG